MPALNVRLSEAEHGQLEAAARAKGQTISRYVRERLLGTGEPTNSETERIDDHEDRISKLEGLAERQQY